ncbi:hypothetical protein BK816_06230 [Boudabousia tangfeifanii]|uniref:Lipoprotein n=1 Tax=Boudabousia tangfeifanii TaxID=1912795 RepID=A0A1D9MKU8_9ACTO|nr:hypothetical protein [Boudabousia tangfeifanii]AOZ72937.1 hypothetical protein BK816_06230 [Boudabousia tangfeifanii]
MKQQKLMTGLAILGISAIVLSGCGSQATTSSSSKTVEPTTSATSTDEATVEVVIDGEQSPEAKQSKQKTPEKPKTLPMNLNQIREGNYESLTGKWVSAEGGTIEAHKDVLIWDTKQGAFAKIKKGQFELVQSVKDHFEGGPFEDSDLGNEALAMQWVAEVDHVAMGSLVAFYPKGVAAKIPMMGGKVIPSDTSRPRILALPGNGVGRLMPENFEPYLMTREGDKTDAEQTAQQGNDCQPPVPGAYACAGKGRPAEAQPIPTVGESYGRTVATLQTPSKNIGCDIDDAGVACLVQSGWPKEIYADYNEFQGGQVDIHLNGNGPVTLGQKSDAPDWPGFNGIPAGHILPYGTVWYYGDYAFASDKTGLTFWNVKTGYGALINRKGYQPFGR